MRCIKVYSISKENNPLISSDNYSTHSFDGLSVRAFVEVFVLSSLCDSKLCRVTFLYTCTQNCRCSAVLPATPTLGISVLEFCHVVKITVLLVPNKPDGFCGRRATLKQKDNLLWREVFTRRDSLHNKHFVFVPTYWLETIIIIIIIIRIIIRC